MATPDFYRTACIVLCVRADTAMSAVFLCDGAVSFSTFCLLIVCFYAINR